MRCTLGLVTPRRPKRLPVVLSANEIERLLKAAPSFRDKLLLGLIYPTGLRVGEVDRIQGAKPLGGLRSTEPCRVHLGNRPTLS